MEEARLAQESTATSLRNEIRTTKDLLEQVKKEVCVAIDTAHFFAMS